MQKIEQLSKDERLSIFGNESRHLREQLANEEGDYTAALDAGMFWMEEAALQMRKKIGEIKNELNALKEKWGLEDIDF